MRIQVRSLALLSGLRIWCCIKVQNKSQWCLGSRVAVAVVYASSAALIWPPTWELPYATSEAVKRKKNYVHDTVLLTIGAMLYSKSLEPTHFRNWNFMLIESKSSFPCLLDPDNHLFFSASIYAIFFLVATLAACGKPGPEPQQWKMPILHC